MVLELFVLGFFGIIGLLVSAAFVWAWVEREKERTALDRAWASYAVSRGLALVPSSGEWPVKRSPTLARSGEGSVVVDIVLHGAEGKGGERTRMRATPDEALLGKIHVDSHAGALTGDIHPTTDSSFDAAFTVRSTATLVADRILNAELRRRLLAFRMGRHVSFTYERGTITLLWARAETNHARLDEALALIDVAREAVHRAYEAPSQSRIERAGAAIPRKLRVVR